MADHASFSLTPTPEQRRVAAQQYERARQALSSHNYDYGIELLCTCCKLDPSNILYRQKLRQTQKAKYNNNMRGSMFAGLAFGAKTSLRVAMQTKSYVKVLERGEELLKRNPWDTPTQLAMARAAEQLGLLDLAVWTLEQARQKNPKDVHVNRPLAELYEKRGNFKQAIAMWDLVSKALPADDEAGRKSKDLAATSTIVHGHYAEATRGEEGATYREAENQAAKEAEEAPAGPPKSSEEIRLSRMVDPLRAKIATDPLNANHYLQLANVYQQAQDLESARKVLEEGLGPTGQHFDLRIQITQLELDPFRENLRLAEERLKSNPEDEKLRRLRIQLLKEINTREMEIFRQRADRYPSELGPRLELGIRLSRAGRTDEAIQELQQARRDPRQKPRALLHLGYCFKSKQNWPLAKRNFEEALQTLAAGEDATRMELLYQLALGSAEQRDWPTAISLGNDLANLDFGYRDIGRMLDEWQENLKQSHVAS